MNRNLIRTSLLMIFMSIPVGYSNAVFAEAPVYSLDPVYVVGAHKVLDSDKFGNIITEQSYYRTGGDVEVVNRKEIEDHHYNSISEAIKSIPGVTFSNPGYRGRTGMDMQPIAMHFLSMEIPVLWFLLMGGV